VQGWTNHDFIDMRFYPSKANKNELIQYAGNFKKDFKKIEGGFGAGHNRVKSNMKTQVE
jgi:hypothetical protein